MTHRHKVFVSYHHESDQGYRSKFEQICKDVIVSRSVDIGDIDTDLKTETIRQRIRDEYLRDSSVTVVLVGARTWQRKHVDWEIASSIRNTEKSPRSGLLGFFLPTYPRKDLSKYNSKTIPPRLYDNVVRKYAMVYNWTEQEDVIQRLIHEAYVRKGSVDPDNSRPLFANNRSGSEWQ